jgi:hypothetical protein
MEKIFCCEKCTAEVVMHVYLYFVFAPSLCQNVFEVIGCMKVECYLDCILFGFDLNVSDIFYSFFVDGSSITPNFV